MRRIAHLAPLLVTLSVHPPAAAQDQLQGTKEQAAFQELEHEIDVSFAHDAARLVVRRALLNRGAELDESVIQIDHPAEAVAVGLRTQGGAEGQRLWFAGKLLGAEQASAQYLRLTGFGAAIPRDPALLYWVSEKKLALQVFPCVPQQVKRVEYTLLLPTQYEAGHEVVELPALGLAEQPAHYTLRSTTEARVKLKGIELTPGSSARITAHKALKVEISYPQAPPLEANHATLALGEGNSWVSSRLRAAARISTVPKGAWIVLVIDGSASLSVPLSKLLAGVRAYLEFFEYPHVAAVVFDRSVRAITPGFVTLQEADERLASWPEQTRNGSAIDRALESAAELFRQVPAQAPRRLLVLTDTLTRSGLADAAIAQTLRQTGALAHLVIPSESPNQTQLNLDDSQRWAAALRASGGLSWNLNLGNQAGENRGAVEELARPLRYRLRSVRIAGGAPQDAFPEFLDEGSEWRYQSVAAARTGQLELEAELWATPIQRQVNSQLDYAKVQAALATIDPDHTFSEREHRHMAEWSGAVTQYTSYLAIEPGVRPSTAGIIRSMDIIGSEGGAGAGGIGLANVRRNSAPFDAETWLKTTVADVRIRCGGNGYTLTLELERTGNEIVDIPRLTLDPPNAQLSECMLNGIWDLKLRGFTETWKRHTFIF